MHTSLKNRRILFSVVIAWGIGSQGAAYGRQVELSLRKDDPNQNSSVVSSIAFSPDGKHLASGHGMPLGMLQEPKPGQTILWETATGNRMNTFPARKDGISSVAFSPDGKVLAVLEYTAIIRLIAVADGREIRKIETNQVDREFHSVAFFPDGMKLAAGVATDGPGNDVLILDVLSGKTIRTLSGHTDAITTLAVSSNGKLLASGSEDGTARIWDARSGKSLKTLTFPSIRKKLKHEAESSVESVAFSPDGQTLATVCGELDVLEEVDLWDTSTGKLTSRLEGIDPFVQQVVFSPDGKLLATAGRGDSITLWNSVTFQEVETIKGIKPVAFSPDGKALAYGKVTTIGVGDQAIDTIRTIVIQKFPAADRR